MLTLILFYSNENPCITCNLDIGMFGNKRNLVHIQPAGCMRIFGVLYGLRLGKFSCQRSHVMGRHT